MAIKLGKDKAYGRGRLVSTTGGSGSGPTARPDSKPNGKPTTPAPPSPTLPTQPAGGPGRFTDGFDNNI